MSLHSALTAELVWWSNGIQVPSESGVWGPLNGHHAHVPHSEPSHLFFFLGITLQRSKASSKQSCHQKVCMYSTESYLHVAFPKHWSKVHLIQRKNAAEWRHSQARPEAFLTVMVPARLPQKTSWSVSQFIGHESQSQRGVCVEEGRSGAQPGHITARGRTWQWCVSTIGGGVLT